MNSKQSGMASPALAPEPEWRLEESILLPDGRIDTRTSPPDLFIDYTATAWQRLSWREAGRPVRVENYSRRRAEWERREGREMPVLTQWEIFNRNFHEMFHWDVPARQAALLSEFRSGPALRLIRDLVRLEMWNRAHRIEDAVFDPRGKRALFDGLDVSKPRILFLGAAEGYEAMQLLAMYPGGEAVLVDYDAFCKTDRFGKFPESYPFVGQNPATGNWRIQRRGDMRMHYEVADIRDLRFGAEFDIVLSVGLVEHFPDEWKPMVFDWHRRFLRPGGYAIFTTPRLQLQSRLYYWLMAELLNFGYRELMLARQLGLYAYENGFEILRCGQIKAHNGIITRPR